MRVVVDANVAVSLALDPVRAAVIVEGIVAGELTPSDADFAWDRIVRMPIVLHELRDGPAAIAVARQLRRQSAYDAS